jgi:hypothetical protein
MCRTPSIVVQQLFKRALSTVFTPPTFETNH